MFSGLASHRSGHEARISWSCRARRLLVWVSTAGPAFLSVVGGTMDSQGPLCLLTLL
jgi:hypothetical protein